HSPRSDIRRFTSKSTRLLRSRCPRWCMASQSSFKTCSSPFGKSMNGTLPACTPISEGYLSVRADGEGRPLPASYQGNIRIVYDHNQSCCNNIHDQGLEEIPAACCRGCAADCTSAGTSHSGSVCRGRTASCGLPSAAGAGRPACRASAFLQRHLVIIIQNRHAFP